MVSLLTPKRPNGVPQMHRIRMIRLLPQNEPFTTVVGRDGLPVDVATTFLLSRRHDSASRQNKVAWVAAVVLDVLAARGIDPSALMLTGDALAPHHVEDIVDALRHIGPRSEGIRRRRARDGERTVLHVENAEWTNRIDIGRKFLVSWMRGALHLLRRDAALHSHMRELIGEIEFHFKESIFAVTTAPREGLRPDQLRFFDQVIHPAHPRNVWGEDRFMLFLICLLYRMLGNRAREPLLLQTVDYCEREGKPALHLLPTDTRFDDRGAPVSLKRAPRYIRIPDWTGDLFAEWIDRERAKVGQRLEAAGNRLAVQAFARCPYMFVSSRGGRLSSTCLYDRFRDLREAFPDELGDLTPARLRNSRADEVVAAARDGDLDLSRVSEGLFGWAVGSDMLGRYAHMEAERQAGNFSRRRAAWIEGGMA